MPDKLLSIAPMMDYTDRHERYFLRLISNYAWMYTEMVTTRGIIHGDKSKLLYFSESEHPIALQLGGSDPKELALCAIIGEDFGYDEINLNVGCPSDRVKHGQFGACLMATPGLVADCIDAMQSSVKIPVTVKCRLGIDNQDDYDNLAEFVMKVSEKGCKEFIVHARKAWLQGLSPKENREIPPLRYDLVYQLKREFPSLYITINGGILNLDEAIEHLKYVDGVMIGRAAYSNPYLLADADRLVFGKSSTNPSREAILINYMDYMGRELKRGTSLNHMSRHILGLFQGQPGAKVWRRYISENAFKSGANLDVIEKAATLIGFNL